MNPDYTVLTTLTAAVFVVGWIWFGPLASLRRDDFRSDIRRIRDELFDYMWRNGHDYDSPSYQCVRHTLNGILRLSNQLTPLHFVLLLKWPTGISGRRITIDETDPALRRELRTALLKAAVRSWKFAFFEGTWGFVLRLIRLGRKRKVPEPESDSITPTEDAFLQIAYAADTVAYSHS